MYTVRIEHKELTLGQADAECYRTPTQAMNWELWWLYVFESFAFGPFFKFWNWKLRARVEEQIRKRTRRIEEDEE